MWNLLDSNTAMLQVPGGTLYRFSDDRGHSLCFVPYVQSLPSYHTSPPMSPHFQYNPAYCSSDNGAVAPR